MPINAVSRNAFLRKYPETLCLSCANGRPTRCAFMALRDPEEGIKKMDANAVKTTMGGRNSGRTRNETEVYKVVECPGYEPGDAYGHTSGGR